MAGFYDQYAAEQDQTNRIPQNMVGPRLNMNFPLETPQSQAMRAGFAAASGGRPLVNPPVAPQQNYANIPTGSAFSPEQGYTMPPQNIPQMGPPEATYGQLVPNDVTPRIFPSSAGQPGAYNMGNVPGMQQVDSAGVPFGKRMIPVKGLSSGSAMVGVPDTLNAPNQYAMRADIPANTPSLMAGIQRNAAGMLGGSVDVPKDSEFQARLRGAANDAMTSTFGNQRALDILAQKVQMADQTAREGRQQQGRESIENIRAGAQVGAAKAMGDARLAGQREGYENKLQQSQISASGRDDHYAKMDALHQRESELRGESDHDKRAIGFYRLAEEAEKHASDPLLDSVSKKRYTDNAKYYRAQGQSSRPAPGPRVAQAQQDQSSGGVLGSKSYL